MIRIVAYDPDWPRQFEAERARLQDTIGAVALRIDHHGSTAVPGLAAKPIIDIQISVARLRPADLYSEPLRRAGYTHMPHADDSFAPFFHRPAEWPHTHHVHVVESGTAEERRTLAFRDFLRSHSEPPRESDALKRALAERFGGGDAESREAYATSKTGFVDAVDVRMYYDQYAEETRLAGGSSQ